MTRLVLPAPFLAAAGCASVSAAPKMAAFVLPENYYDTLPWLMQPPVNIYQRGAGSGEPSEHIAGFQEYRAKN